MTVTKWKDPNIIGPEDVRVRSFGADALLNESAFYTGMNISVAAGSNGSVVIENPAASGFNVVVFLMRLWFSSGSEVEVTFHHGVTMNGTEDTLDPINAVIGSANAAVANTFGGSNILSNTGTLIPAHGAVEEGSPYELQGAAVIPPGADNVAFRVVNPGGLSSANLRVSVGWYEVPV